MFLSAITPKTLSTCYLELSKQARHITSHQSVYRFQMVNEVHNFDDGLHEPGEHMYAHVDDEMMGSKGGNNKASLNMRTLKHLNLLREDKRGRTLSIFFDNCFGQNKNITVLGLVAEAVI